MRKKTGIETLRHHDGTSQGQRHSAALDPNYVSVDERSIADLIRFAQKYSEKLLFIDATTKNIKDWSSFLQGDPDEMAALLDDPNFIFDDPHKKSRYSRPHLVLFLTFLKLLQPVRAQINQLTRRHLEFYYEQALRLTRKSASPDLVHISAQLLPQEDQVLIPEGTLLHAGTDSKGDDLIYKTEEELLANQAQVAQIMSLHVQKQKTGLAEVRSLRQNHPDGGFMDMLLLMYGDKGLRSTSLPVFKDTQAAEGEREMNDELLQGLDELMTYVTGTLHMRLSTFSRIVQLYLRWYEESTWKKINGFLVKAFDTRKNKELPQREEQRPDFSQELRNFNKNFEKATSIQPLNDSIPFDGLQEINNVYDLYRVLDRLQREEPKDLVINTRIDELITFILGNAKDENSNPKGLFFPSIDNFMEMMGLRIGGLKKLREILDILRTIVQSEQGLSFNEKIDEFDYFTEGHLLEIYFKNVLQKQDGPSSSPEPTRPPVITPFHPHKRSWTEDFYEILKEIPRYFNMQVSDYHFIRKVFQAEIAGVAEDGQESVTQPDWKWERIFTLAQNAYQKTDPPEPAEIKWKNLFLARDATSITPDTKTDLAQERWRTFGKVGYEEEMETGRIGFAIASPMLQLSEGKRILILTLGFAEHGFEENFSDLRAALDGKMNDEMFPLKFFVSTAEDSIEVKAQQSLISENGLADFTIKLDGENIYENIPVQLRYPRSIQFVLEISPEIPPLAPLVKDGQPVSKWPMLAVQLVDQPILDDKENTIAFEKQYDLFRKLQLINIHLAAHVTEITNFIVQNDSGQPDPKKPFEPFGVAPRVGDSLYITHPDLARQKLDNLKFHLEWKNLPENGLGQYYRAYKHLAPEANYQIPITKNADFEVTLSFRDGSFEHHLASNIKLFPDKPLVENDISFRFSISKFKGGVPYRRKPEISVTEGEALEWERYFKLELGGPDFQHEKYATLIDRQSFFLINGKFYDTGKEEKVIRKTGTNKYQLKQNPVPGLTKENFMVSTTQSQKTITVDEYDEKNRQLILSGSATNAIVNYLHNPYQDFILYPPFVPVIKQVGISYQTHIEFLLGAERTKDEHQLIHLTSTGTNPLELNQNLHKSSANSKGRKARIGYHLFPSYEKQGELFIGIRNLNPPQTLSLLFQLAEGSQNPNVPAARVNWHYLKGTDWESLEEGQLLSDTTQGLLTSGIIRFAIPDSATIDHSLMPAGLHWIRASIEKDADSIADVISIETQVVRAIFMDQKNAADHYLQSLPANSIESLVDPIPGIGAIVQSHPSFRGNPREQDQAYYTRVSERLRHKQRALTLWDYERLVLEEFPDVHKVRALHANLQEDPNALGVVELVLIPNIRGKQLYDPFEPRVSHDLLREVKTFLQIHCTPFVELRIKNPTFYYLIVKLDVRFHDMSNPGFYLELLNRELREFLSPWLFDTSAEIVFGGEVYDSVIVNFLENRSYINFIEYPVLLVQRRDSNGKHETLEFPHVFRGDDGHISIQRPDVVLVSAPEHRISLIPDDEDRAYRKGSGIGQMEIELDFRTETQPIFSLTI